MHEVVIKRTVWVAKHEECQFTREYLETPPREVQCPVCKGWIVPVEQAWAGKEIGNASPVRR